MKNREVFYCSGQSVKCTRAADTDADENIIWGYAAVFNTPFETKWMREFVRPGAFSRALREKQDVRALFNHDINQILGRSSANTLRLMEDTIGLRYEIDTPDRSDAKDLRVSIKRGDITGSSFGFHAVKEEWNESGAIPERSLIDVDLYDVGPVTFPAYDDTAVAIRSLEEWRKQHKPQTTPLSLLAARQRHALALGS